MKLFRNMQERLGDSLMMTSAIRDYKNSFSDAKIYVDSFFPEIWENNLHIEGISTENNFINGVYAVDEGKTHQGNVYDIGGGKILQGSKTNGLHYTEAFKYSIEEKLGVKIQQGELKPELFLSDKEKSNKIINGDYWLISTSCGPGFTSKLWVSEYWQKVVDLLPNVAFVQIGTKGGNGPILKSNNVLNFIGQTENLRDLFTLFYHAQGVVSLVSAPMHIAAAFNKPCVVIAGAREPHTFEQYSNHRYLQNIGCLPCVKKYACWAKGKDACWFKYYQSLTIGQQLDIVPYEYREKSSEFCARTYAQKNKKDHVPKCMEMITPAEVVWAISKYYTGGLLKKAEKRTNVSIAKKKIFKIVCNAKFIGGAERSCLEIIKGMHKEGYEVHVATRKGIVCNEFLSILPEGAVITSDITGECDIFLLYASDMVFDFHLPEFDIFKNLKAKKKIMALTYKLGRAGKVDWTLGWDKYLFLSSDMKNNFLSSYHVKIKDVLQSETIFKVFPPMVDLAEFFDIKPKYKSTPINIGRHSSQGDLKHSLISNRIVSSNPEKKFSFMPPPTFLNKFNNVIKYKENEISVKQFLSALNCFMYLLPFGYTDQGPRVIMEAMAAGLPVIAENRDGAKDRIDSSCGWLVDSHEEVFDVIESLTPEILEKKGKAARERARTFSPNLWIKEIIN